MKPESDAVPSLLAELSAPGLPEALRQRTLTLARAQLEPSPESAPQSLRVLLPAHASTAALLSADVAFLINTWLNISRAFGD